MYKAVVYVFAIVVALVNAEPKPKADIVPIAAAYSAPVVAPAIVTAQSSQVIARNYHGLVQSVAPVVAAPLVKTSLIAAAAPVIKSAPLVAAPVAYSAPHYQPYYSPYIASPVVV